MFSHMIFAYSLVCFYYLSIVLVYADDAFVCLFILPGFSCIFMSFLLAAL